MTNSENKAEWNSATGEPPPKYSSDDEVGPPCPYVTHGESFGRIEIAPAKPIWPSTK